MNTSILKNPMMSIPLSFTFPKCSYREYSYIISVLCCYVTMHAPDTLEKKKIA